MKSNQKLTLLFWHRKSKADNNGNAPIICRISIDGEEEELSIGRKVHLNNWDAENKIATGGGTEEKKTNLKIAQVTGDLERHFTVLQLDNEYISPLMLKNVYKGLPAEHQKGKPKPQAQKSVTLLEVADTHIHEFAKMVDKGIRSKETLKQWKATRKNIIEFLKFEYEAADMDISEITYSFADEHGNDNMKQVIEANYRQVKADVVHIVESEMERIKNDPNLQHLVQQE